ncbi:hypothetical protein SAMN05444065_109270 [Pseudomonas syringae]|uniref:BTB domain-containing protein n=1 Tax=Pseudomonas syringae TaxID=317 RepID=A0AB38BVM2_PSESX|nr:hypothetical protein SAMN05444065_109270 [Pseudomonas syringae]SFO66183.1 hypothetical protein SAMN05444063_11418 [Pseudomonas syringae]
MARPDQNVNCISGREHKFVFERSPHARPHPITGLKSPLLVMHNFVSKQEHWLAACSDYFRSLIVGDHGIQDDPLFDDA